MSSIKKIINNVYFKSVFITLIMILIIFAVRGVYPFGKETVSNADMAQAFLPAYYNLWDFFHGSVGLFFNFNIGAGSNIFDTTSVYGLLSPLNWIVALTNRNNIVNFIDYVLILKVLFISLTSSILFKNLFKKVSDNKIAIFSMLYALSGYIIVYHTNISWLESVGLFPLIILGLFNIVNKKSIKLYVIALTLSLLFSFYITYMSLLFVLFASGIYLFINRKNKDVDINKTIFELGIGTVFSLGLSAFINLPVIYQTLHSYRFGLSNVNNNSFSLYNTLNKLVLLCFYGMPYVYLFKNISNYKKNKKVLILLLSLLSLTTLPILLEKINLMWHTGSYLLFPNRFAYIPTLLVYLGALFYLNNNEDKEKINNNKIIKYINPILITGSFITIIYLYKKYFNISLVNKTPASINAYSLALKYILVIFILSFITTYLITKLNNKLLRKGLIVLLLFIQVIASTKFYIGLPRNILKKEHSDETIFYATDIYKFGINDKTNYKYKDYNNSMIENYPFISKKASLSTWHMIDKEQKDIHNLLGYGVYGTKMLDKGGTIFSDQLLGVNRIISEIKFKDDFYKKIGTTGKYYIYEYNKTLPYGIIYNTSNYLETLNYKTNRVKNYNIIYNKLFNNKEILFTNPEITKEETKKIDKYKVKIEDNSYLYFIAKVDKNIEIKINGKKIVIPSLNNISNTLYDKTAGMIYLGEFEDKIVEIEILKDEKEKYKPEFILLNKSKYLELLNNYKQDNIKYKYSNDLLTIKVNNTSKTNKSLFIPITYNEGLSCKVNGKNVEVKRVVGNYISIDLEKGENNIVIKFVPPYLKVGIIISIISLVLLIIIYKYVLKDFKLKVLPKIAKYIFIIIWIIAFIYIYIYQLIK